MVTWTSIAAWQFCMSTRQASTMCWWPLTWQPGGWTSRASRAWLIMTLPKRWTLTCTGLVERGVRGIRRALPTPSSPHMKPDLLVSRMTGHVTDGSKASLAMLPCFANFMGPISRFEACKICFSYSTALPAHPMLLASQCLVQLGAIRTVQFLDLLNQLLALKEGEGAVHTTIADQHVEK